jgi:thioredoxin-like negative regulator of GroEL
MNKEILFFSSPWCGPCRQIKSMLSKEIISELGIRIVDIADDMETATAHEVMNVPTFVKIVEGVEVARVIGMTTIDTLRKL